MTAIAINTKEKKDSKKEKIIQLLKFKKNI